MSIQSPSVCGVILICDWDSLNFEPHRCVPVNGVASVPLDGWDGKDDEDGVK